MTNPSIFAAFERMWQHIIALVGDKANANHNHDDMYYTEVEIDTMLQTKSDSTHNHDSDYDTKGSAETALDTAKAYTDTKTSGLASTSSVNTSISNHNTSTTSHEDIRALIDGLTTRLNTVANSDDTTLDQLSEIVAYIKANKTLIDGITTSKINVSDIVNNLTTNSTTKVLSAAQGVAINGLIDALQAELDSHTHTIGADASDDDVILLTGTGGTDGVSYSVTHNISGVTAGTYKSVTVDERGHVTNGSNPTTIEEYGITDAYTKTDMDSALAGKSNTGHIHDIEDVTDLQSSLDDKVSISRTVNGKTLESNITLSASDVGADPSGSASSALSSAQAYTDEQVAQKTQVQVIIWGDDD